MKKFEILWHNLRHKGIKQRIKEILHLRSDFKESEHRKFNVKDLYEKSWSIVLIKIRSYIKRYQMP